MLILQALLHTVNASAAVLDKAAIKIVPVSSCRPSRLEPFCGPLTCSCRRGLAILQAAVVFGEAVTLAGPAVSLCLPVWEPAQEGLTVLSEWCLGLKVRPVHLHEETQRRVDFRTAEQESAV